MYPISEELAQLFINGTRQVVNISVNGEETFTLDESVIKNLTITRQSTTEQTIYLGGVVSHQLNLSILNNGDFSDVLFEGAEMFVQLGVDDNGRKLYFPCGYFIVDEPTRPLAEINIKALDRMMLFEKKVGDEFYTWFPCSVRTLLSNVCSACNVTLATNIATFPNVNYVITNAPTEEDLSYRQVLVWLCELMGKCAYFNEQGELCIDFYHTTEDYEIDESLRFSSDILEKPITITGVKASTEEIEYLVGTEDYCFNLEGNSLLQDNYESVLNNIFAEVEVTYYPSSCETLPLPFLYPMDGITFKVGEEEYHTFLTGVSFSLNGRTNLQGVGESNQNKGYASQNPLTNREKVIINKIKAEINETLNERIQSVLALNDLVANTMGFWRTTETLSDGSQILYIHDKPNLAESKSVWRLSGGVFTWTDDYQGSSTVWQSGVSAGGNAWFRYVSSIGITLSDANNEWNSEFTPNAWFIKKGEMYAMQVDNTTGEVRMVIPKLIIDNPSTEIKDGYMEVGKVRFQPYSEDGVCVGAGFIQVD